MVAGGGAEDQEEFGPLVFQRGKKLNDEYYIVSVRDNAESACVKFSAYELESSETFDISYSYADFDALFKGHTELVNPSDKEGRYDWVVDRLDFVSDSSGGAKRLTLANEPTVEDEAAESKTSGPAKTTVPKDRLTYAERTRLRAEAEKLEEKRAANIALKSEKNRKAFVAELQEKRKLEELKVASRRQRIDEERAERREKSEMEKRISEERQKRYEENDKKREVRISKLETDRKQRDMQEIRAIIEEAAQKKERLLAKLEDARMRKQDQEKKHAVEMAARRDAEDKINAKREQRIQERNDRLKTAEQEYLEFRKRQIEEIAQQRQAKEEKKQEHLRERATQRATQLRAKHEKIDAWERLDDQRTQNNLTKEHARNMLMLDHIESLRQRYSSEQAAAAARKQASLEQRREREAKEADDLAKENRRKSDLEQKRNRNIAQREGTREQKNQQYCDHIRDLKTTEALRVKDQAELVASARSKQREERATERQLRAEQELAAAQINAQREENIRRREKERDGKFAQSVREMHERDRQKELESEARKIQKRLQEKEASVKRQEEEQVRKRQMAALEAQREQMIRDRAADRNRREQERSMRTDAPAAGETEKLSRDLSS